MESLGGPKTAGLGFGSGLERLLLTMEAQGVTFPDPDTPDLFLAAMGEEADFAVQTLVYELRKLGIAAERDTCGRSLKAQMKYADKLSAAYSAVIGEQELIDGKISLKNMQTGEKEDCELSAGAIFAHIMEGEE